MDAETEPERQPSRRTLTLIVVPIIVLVVIGMVGNAIHPRLLKDYPLVLIAMEPRLRYLLLVAERVDFVPFLVVATVRRLLSDPLFYLLGHLYGDRAVRWIEQRMGGGGTFIQTVERWFGRFAPLFVFVSPGPLVCVLAGATSMRLTPFVLLNIAGTVTSVIVSYQFADLVSGPIGWINGFYSRNNNVLIVVSITLTVLWVANQFRTGRSPIQSVGEIERDLETDDPKPG